MPRYLAWAVLLMALVGSGPFVTVACGPPSEMVMEPVVSQPVAQDQPYLVRRFHTVSDAQAWINEYSLRYRLHTLSAAGSRVFVVLCNHDRGFCDPPETVMAY